MRSIKSGIGIFSITLFILVTLGAWKIYSPGTQIEKLRMAEASQPVFALIYLAESLGYFADEKLEITYDSYTSGRDALNSVVSGKNDIATVYETPVVLQAFNGVELAVVAELHNSTSNTGLVARKDRGIHVAADLRGKRIGVPLKTNAEFFVSLFLSSHGIHPNEVTLVPVKPNDMAATLKGDTVDAISVWNPNLYKTKAAFSEDEITSFYSDVYTEISVLALKRDNADQRGEAILRLLRALKRAEAYLKENSAEAKKLVIAQLPPNVQITAPHVWDAFSAELKLDTVLLSTLQGEADWLKEAGSFSDKSMPDFTALIDTQYLNEIYPQAVTIE
ncbi:hypothetical protein A9Q83_04695 [Alphaproteobacteria bacterium 46_93_T64]|nr:hypothetical protein A9Q83_04695 [Alphaproteobacteria bacterium 46_93_T64]